MMMMMMMMMKFMIKMMITAEACRSVARSISTSPHDGFGGSRDTVCPPGHSLGDDDFGDGGHDEDVDDDGHVGHDDGGDGGDDDYKEHLKEGRCKGLKVAPFAAPGFSIKSSASIILINNQHQQFSSIISINNSHQ